MQAETALLLIPELGFELLSGTLGGRFTTVEGLLVQARDQLVNSLPFSVGDSADEGSKSKLQAFVEEMNEVRRGEEGGREGRRGRKGRERGGKGEGERGRKGRVGGEREGWGRGGGRGREPWWSGHRGLHWPLKKQTFLNSITWALRCYSVCVCLSIFIYIHRLSMASDWMFTSFWTIQQETATYRY